MNCIIISRSCQEGTIAASITQAFHCSSYSFANNVITLFSTNHEGTDPLIWCMKAFSLLYDTSTNAVFPSSPLRILAQKL